PRLPREGVCPARASGAPPGTGGDPHGDLRAHLRRREGHALEHGRRPRLPAQEPRGPRIRPAPHPHGPGPGLRPRPEMMLPLRWMLVGLYDRMVGALLGG